ncbi:hypothetical protein V2J09_008142 [Rumex salicifolius]
MERVFSVDEFSGQFWSPPGHLPVPASDPALADPKMNRSSSEWAFQRFLQEAAAISSQSDINLPSKSVEETGIVIKDHQHQKDSQSYFCESNQVLNRNLGPAAPQPHVIQLNPAAADSTATATASYHTGSNIPVDADKFQAFLKSRLNLACAAVALTRAPYVIGQSPSGAAESTSQGSTDSQAVTQSPARGSKEMDVGAPVGIPSLPTMPKNHAVQIKPTTSSSSRDQSDDDEAEGENEITDNMDPADVKRVRRMLSNRESARRSRSRKQKHVNELQTQVSGLKGENSSLINRFTDISQKYNESAVDNRVLKADVETLRAKVKMAEETVKRVTGMNSLFQTMSDIPTINIPAFSGRTPNSVDVTAISAQHNPKQHSHQPPPGPSTASRFTNDYV